MSEPNQIFEPPTLRRLGLGRQTEDTLHQYSSRLYEFMHQSEADILRNLATQKTLNLSYLELEEQLR